jgi:glycosyltransferase involved in cell wall biosynthesis
MSTVIVIPAYNEEKMIGEVIRGCQRQNKDSQIVVIDDGSKDRTKKIAQEAGAIVLSHPINRGLGASLSTGLTAALLLLKDKEGIIVTLDADGQHDPREIPKLIEPILKGEAEVVIGSRFISSERKKIPFLRYLANWCGNFFTWLLFGIKVTDSQSGFRAFSFQAAQKIRLRTNTMEVSSEIIREIKLNNLKLKEVPITPIYTDYSLSKGQGFWRGLETLWKLIILRFFR